MTQAAKRSLMARLFTEKAMPEFPFEIDRVSYLDGCKVYFKNGGWVICRFSGTEPLLRMCSEMPDEADAGRCIDIWKQFLKL
jgi:phosphomannomutase